MLRIVLRSPLHRRLERATVRACPAAEPRGGPFSRWMGAWRKWAPTAPEQAGSAPLADGRFAERRLTVVASCRQQSRAVLVFLVAAGETALHGTAAPSVLPALGGD